MRLSWLVLALGANTPTHHAHLTATLGTVDYLDPKDSLILRIHPYEQRRLILQLGAAGPMEALQAARMVEQDIVAVDLNCGCPKRFSVIAGRVGWSVVRGVLCVYCLLPCCCPASYP